MQKKEDLTAETRSATITRKPGGLLETRFKEHAMIDNENMLENIVTRRELCAGEPHALLTVVPDHVEFATSVMSPDLLPGPLERARIKAIALVAPVGVPGLMARLYFSCFPDVADTKVFSTEDQAMDWLRPHLEN